jgi:hypothetical protein
MQQRKIHIPKRQGDDHAGRHDAGIEPSFHDLESLDRRCIVGHGMVDEQARQVEQPGEPGNHENDVK